MNKQVFKATKRQPWCSLMAVIARNAKPTLVVLLLGVMTISSARIVAVHAAQAAQRPLSDFLSKQGTTMVFNAPVPDQIGWANNPPNQFNPTRFALFDYAGFAAQYLAANGITLGTSVSGSVSERPLADGRAEVTVILHTMNALAWASSAIGDVNANPPLFGYRPAELVANPSQTPALGESHLRVVFKNTAPGADLPDLVNAFALGNTAPGQELVSLSFRATASGPLRAASGLGPEGTPGLCEVTQTGLLMTSFKGATADAFPTERVELRAIGH